MDRFAELQTFVRVAEAGSISRAAERMQIAKSAVSRRISDLEGRLDVQLFHRTTRSLNLTDSGRGFFEQAKRILADLDESEAAVSQAHGELSGVLRIAAPVSFGLMHLSTAITDFMLQHPKVNFDIDFNDRQIDLLQEGFDIAVRIAKLSDSNLIARNFSRIEMVVCASPGYLKQHGTPKTPEDLITHQCLLYSHLAEPHIWRYSDKQGNKASVKVPQVHRVNNGEFMRQACIEGIAIIMQPTFIAYQAIEKKQLIPLLTDYQWPVGYAYAVYPQTRHLSQRVRSFVDFLVERYAGVPYWDKMIKE